MTEKRRQRMDLVKEALEPVRKAYRATNYKGKSYLLAEIIRYVTS